jgi:hypothetical protein
MGSRFASRGSPSWGTEAGGPRTAAAGPIYIAEIEDRLIVPASRPFLVEVTNPICESDS